MGLDLKSSEMYLRLLLLRTSTIPDKRVKTRSKFSPLPTFNVDNQVIFPSFLKKDAVFSNIDLFLPFPHFPCW